MSDLVVTQSQLNTRKIPPSLKQERYRANNVERIRQYDRERNRAKMREYYRTHKSRSPLAEIARRVEETEVSEPLSEVWRKGPSIPINPGWPCWVLTFDEWPQCKIYSGIVLHVDLTEKLYIVNIEGRKWSINRERIFSIESAAHQEAQIYEIMNTACYNAKALDVAAEAAE